LKYDSYKKIWHLAWPLVLSGLGQTVINVTDTIFLGRISEAVLGAAAICGLFYASFAMISNGLGTGTQILIARYSGSGETDNVSSVFNQANLLQLILSVIITALLFVFYVPIIHLLINNYEVREASIEFLKYRFIGFIPFFLLVSLRSFYAGIGNTKIIAHTALFLAVLNFVLNYLLVFGFSIIPPLGIKGSAIASSISEWVAFLFIVIYTFQLIKKKQMISFSLTLNIKQQKEIVLLSYPLVFQFVITLISWLMFFVIIEKIGSAELAISNVLRNVYLIVMIPAFAFNQVASTAISHHIGLNDFANLKQILKKVLLFSFTITAFIIILCSLSPTYLLGIFTNQEYLINMGIPLLKLIFFALILCSVSLPLLNALAATGKTKTTFMIELVMVFLYLFFAYLFAIVLKLNLMIVWSVEVLYFLVIGVASYYYFNCYVNKKTDTLIVHK